MPGVISLHMPKPAQTSPFWEIIVSLSRERGMSLSKLARAADINRQGMEKWKDPEVEPTLESMRRLAAALDVPLSRLTGAGKNAYASLQQWLEAHPDTDDDLADWLWSQSFRFGDPGPSTWDLLSATYRTARSQAEGREHAPSSPKRR